MSRSTAGSRSERRVGPEDLVASAAYQPEPTAAAAARRFVRDTLQTWVATGAATDGHGLVDDAVLLTSELVTNAVIHAGTQVHLTCRLADGAVEVVVRDGHPSRLVPEVAGDGSGPACSPPRSLRPGGSRTGAAARRSGSGSSWPDRAVGWPTGPAARTTPAVSWRTPSV